MKQLLLFVLLGMSVAASAIKPEKEYRWTPESRGLKYTEYQVKTSDNYSINVWEYGLAETAKPGRTIIIVGTDAGNMGYFIWQAKALVEKGIRVIAFDYRGFGKSSDFAINKDFLFHNEFALDLDSVIKETRKKFPEEKIGLYSMSMGTYISLIRREKIDYVIAEGFYNNPQKVIERIKVNKGKDVLLPARAKTIQKLKKKIPILIFCADEDMTTITGDARDFAKNNNVTLIEFKGGHLHGLSVMTKNEPGDEYAERIVKFLTDNGFGD